MSFKELNSGPMPTRSSKIFWVETMPAHSKVNFSIGSKSIWQLWTHFSGRTKPCFKDRSRCAGGHDDETLRWYGYLFGWHQHLDRAAFLQLTLGAARQLYDCVAKGASLRGMMIQATRPGKKNSRMYVKVTSYENVEESRIFIGDEDPTDSLFKMWHVPRVNDRMDLRLGDGPQDLPESEKIA